MANSKRDLAKGKVRRFLALSLALGLGTAMPMTTFAFSWFGNGSQEGRAEQTQENGYVFQSGATVIQVGTEAGQVLAALGETTKPVFEQDSCAYQGKDRVYSYAGFEVTSGQKDGKDYITSVYLLDASVATPEGIRVGSTVQEVQKAYGECKDDFGVYRYTKGNTELSVFTTKGVVDSIEYLLLTT